MPIRLRVGLVALYVWLVVPFMATPLVAQEPPRREAGASSRTVEGCLTRPDASAGSSTAGQFVLVDESAKTTPAARQPTGGAVPAPPQASMYVLKSDDQSRVRFPLFVGHRVRVSGTTTAPATTAPLAGRSPEATPYQAPVASATTTSGATGTPFDTANLPTLSVRSITSLADTCK